MLTKNLRFRYGDAALRKTSKYYLTYLEKTLEVDQPCLNGFENKNRLSAIAAVVAARPDLVRGVADRLPGPDLLPSPEPAEIRR